MTATTTSLHAQRTSESHTARGVQGRNLPTDQSTDDVPGGYVGGDPDTPGIDHKPCDAHTALVGPGEGRPAIEAATAMIPTLADPTLALAADVVDDLESVRIAEENRLRALTDPEQFGLPEDNRDVARLRAIVDALAAVEHDAVLNLQRAVRAHPLGEWQRAQRGVGEKTFARLLATMGGDPYVNLSTGEPRTLHQLWQFCGHGDPERRLRKGMTQADLFACGSPVAKKRLWLIATACLKAGGPYADAYRARRAETADRVHAKPCVRCGPSGHPAAEGSPWSAAHAHADALRIVGKAILRDLWHEARRLHGVTDDEAVAA